MPPVDGKTDATRLAGCVHSSTLLIGGEQGQRNITDQDQPGSGYLNKKSTIPLTNCGLVCKTPQVPR